MPVVEAKSVALPEALFLEQCSDEHRRRLDELIRVRQEWAREGWMAVKYILQKATGLPRSQWVIENILKCLDDEHNFIMPGDPVHLKWFLQYAIHKETELYKLMRRSSITDTAPLLSPTSLENITSLSKQIETAYYTNISVNATKAMTAIAAHVFNLNAKKSSITAAKKKRKISNTVAKRRHQAVDGKFKPVREACLTGDFARLQHMDGVERDTDDFSMIVEKLDAIRGARRDIKIVSLLKWYTSPFVFNLWESINEWLELKGAKTYKSMPLDTTFVPKFVDISPGEIHNYVLNKKKSEWRPSGRLARNTDGANEGPEARDAYQAYLKKPWSILVGDNMMKQFRRFNGSVQTDGLSYHLLLDNRWLHPYVPKGQGKGVRDSSNVGKVKKKKPKGGAGEPRAKIDIMADDLPNPVLDLNQIDPDSLVLLLDTILDVYGDDPGRNPLSYMVSLDETHRQDSFLGPKHTSREPDSSKSVEQRLLNRYTHQPSSEVPEDARLDKRNCAFVEGKLEPLMQQSRLNDLLDQHAQNTPYTRTRGNMNSYIQKDERKAKLENGKSIDAQHAESRILAEFHPSSNVLPTFYKYVSNLKYVENILRHEYSKPAYRLNHFRHLQYLQRYKSEEAKNLKTRYVHDRHLVIQGACTQKQAPKGGSTASDRDMTAAICTESGALVIRVDEDLTSQKCWECGGMLSPAHQINNQQVGRDDLSKQAHAIKKTLPDSYVSWNAKTCRNPRCPLNTNLKEGTFFIFQRDYGSVHCIILKLVHYALKEEKPNFLTSKSSSSGIKWSEIRAAVSVRAAAIRQARAEQESSKKKRRI